MIKKEVRKIITEELIRDIKTESVSIYNLLFQSYKVEQLSVLKAEHRANEAMKDFTDRLVDRLKEMGRK